MARRFVSQLADQEKVDEIFLASAKQLRPNRNGNLYLQVRLSDKTGSVMGMLWNAQEQVFQQFENGDFLRVQGTAQLYNGTVQLIVQRLDRVSPQGVNEEDFVTLAEVEVSRLSGRLETMLRGMRNVSLRHLAEAFLLDESFMAQFTAAPAGVKNHHAYKGGLLQHVVSLMELCAVVAPRYPELDPDLLLMGAFLHDVGKIEELTYQRDLGYSDEGQLVGHVVQGVVLVDRKLGEAEKLAGEPIPAELAQQVKHMIVSHHGSYEYGSPKLPMTLEAIALHQLDDLDAKLFNVGQIMRDDAQPDTAWTTWQPNLQRKFFKGTHRGERRNES